MKNKLLDILIRMTNEDGQFKDPGWMQEFFTDLIRKNQLIIRIDSNDCVTAFLGYWKFGNKRFKYIKNITTVTKCPKQMSKGKHLYIPIVVLRPDVQGNGYMKSFLSSLKRRVPDATTISWHDSKGKFRTHKVIREDKKCQFLKRRTHQPHQVLKNNT